MKVFALSALGLAQIGSAYSSSELFASFAKPHDAGSVLQKMTGMMAESKQKLALAERRHAKVVKKVRKEAAAALDEEAKAYGKYISGYSAELTKAENDYVRVVGAAKKGLAAAEAAPSTLNDWKDPDTEKKAKLNAQVASADRAVKKAERRRGRQVREAEERGEEALEDEAQKLGMKVGDMTPLVDEAKKTLDTVAEKQVALAAGEAVADSNTTTAKKVNLTALEDDLEKATPKNQAEITGANKRLDGFLAKTGKEVGTKIAKLEKDLEAKSREEIDKVIGKPKAGSKLVAKKPVPAKSAAVKADSKLVAKKPVPAKSAAVKADSKLVAKKPVPAKAAVVKAKATTKAVPAKAH